MNSSSSNLDPTGLTELESGIVKVTGTSTPVTSYSGGTQTTQYMALKVLNFGVQKVPTFKEARGKDWILFGEEGEYKNRYPE